jgi:hypothetical protein
MSRFDSLPADQKAVLQLVLKQGKRYEDIAAMLRMEPAAVRERARDALDALGPEEAPGLTGDRQDEIADYLLGQQDDPRETLEFLEGSAGGRAWARVVADEIAPIAGGRELPEIPEEGTGTVAVAPPAPVAAAPVAAPTRYEDDDEDFEDDDEPVAPAPTTARARESAAAAAAPADGGGGGSSKLGGALILLGVAALLALVLVIALSGGDDKKDSASVSSSTPSKTSTSGSSTTKVEAQINLRPTSNGGKSLGVANVVSQGGQRAIALIGQSLSASPRYAVWLYNSPTDSQFLGFAPPVKANGRLQGLAPVPDDFSRYKQIIITREQVDRPQKPGLIVLSGSLKA